MNETIETIALQHSGPGGSFSRYLSTSGSLTAERTLNFRSDLVLICVVTSNNRPAAIQFI
jgi:hypothetical protein